ncbi:hypothetical protein DSM112329_00646 [Paraconexibacter sp. AEG42_29]|uniref:CbtA family protein n=1 Tax=Paraconexibacter sp. AEG42_29 TaxID=2997339 RepID=A0AAU7AQ68_9ACTN
MVRSLLIRGMLVGLLAGLLAFAVAYIFGEPQVQKAIDYEGALAAAAGEAGGEPLVSRGVQRSIGLATGTIALGVALGGMFALVYAYAYGRISVKGARSTAAALALTGFVTITLVPFTKYPASPPALNADDTIDRRTLLFFAMVAISMLAFVGAARIRREFLDRLGPWNAAILAGVTFIAVIVVAQLILPAVHETPATYPADVMYRFRVASLAISATLWATIGLAFGAAAERLLAPVAARRSAPAGAEPA